MTITPNVGTNPAVTRRDTIKRRNFNGHRCRKSLFVNMYATSATVVTPQSEKVNNEHHVLQSSRRTNGIRNRGENNRDDHSVHNVEQLYEHQPERQSLRPEQFV